MADPPAYPDAGEETEAGPDSGSAAGTPRWVKIFGVVALIVVVLFVVVLLVGGGEHGPGRHTPGGSATTTSETLGGHTGPPPGFEHGEQQP